MHVWRDPKTPIAARAYTNERTEILRIRSNHSEWFLDYPCDGTHWGSSGGCLQAFSVSGAPLEIGS